jgi:protein-S-isoprenylcysteine O-methyltransferase Ste14
MPDDATRPASNAAHDAAPVRLPPPLVYLLSLLAGALLQRFAFALPLALPGALRALAAAALILGGSALVLAAFGLFRTTGQNPAPWTPSPELIGEGVYRFTRNPMYLGMTLLQAGIGVAAANGWIAALALVSAAIVRMTAIRHEEAYLERKFGAPYLAYKQRVRRWF